MIGGSPVIWSFMMESEYIAFSTACKELIPIKNIASEIAKACGVNAEDPSSMHTTIWEGKVGCLTLAKLDLPVLTPNSKAIAVCNHWFHQFLSKDQGRDGGTKDQIADIYTKGLAHLQFSTLNGIVIM